MKLRYGYIDHRPQKRLTPKSAFLRKLERMQSAAAKANGKLSPRIVVPMVRRK